MKVMLKRDLFLGGSRYRQDNRGTEIPDMVGEAKVVFADSEKKDEPKTLVLPIDAVPYTADAPKQAFEKRVQMPQPKPMALSELPGAKAQDPQFSTTGKK